MLDYNNNNNDATTPTEQNQEGYKTNNTVKPHVVRRNIEDYLERRALKKRLRDVFDEDFLLD